MDASDWVTAVIAALALGVAIWSAIYSRRSVLAAERSAAAAEALVPAPPPPVAWNLEWVKGDLYLLRNVGKAPATEVRIAELPAGAGILKTDAQPMTIPKGEPTRVYVIGTAQTGKATSLKVECAELAEASIVPVRR